MKTWFWMHQSIGSPPSRGIDNLFRRTFSGQLAFPDNISLPTSTVGKRKIPKTGSFDIKAGVQCKQRVGEQWVHSVCYCWWCGHLLYLRWVPSIQSCHQVTRVTDDCYSSGNKIENNLIRHYIYFLCSTYFFSINAYLIFVLLFNFFLVLNYFLMSTNMSPVNYVVS